MAGQALAVRKQESVRCHQLIEHHVQDFQLCIERTQTSNFSLGELQGGAKASLTYPRGPTAARFWPPREWRPTPLARDLVHQVSDWGSGAAANFDWMREAKRENTRGGL